MMVAVSGLPLMQSIDAVEFWSIPLGLMLGQNMDLLNHCQTSGQKAVMVGPVKFGNQLMVIKQIRKHGYTTKAKASPKTRYGISQKEHIR